MDIDIAEFVAAWPSSPFFVSNLAPWELTASATEILYRAIQALGSEYDIQSDVAVHTSATVEGGAIVKGPAIIGPRAFVAASAYLRGGVYLDENCIVGPACEVKTTFIFSDSKIAHLSFVGDSILGSDVNIEAGAIVANYRNEMDDKRIRIAHEGRTIETGVEKFGALIGDGAKVGANSTIAPGALITPGSRLLRLSRIDQHPSLQS
jgi:UDP-N-acetylglucosamine diphosphorylase / glucose-1-phosphate thymidylyltransferase / UDP-N-acetylgalactosamine diphosphorylase / glucosamine-1-phosphate N-acetyltransferase / galactosamine-1-phosphate N-acetyltransferase